MTRMKNGWIFLFISRTCFEKNNIRLNTKFTRYFSPLYLFGNNMFSIYNHKSIGFKIIFKLFVIWRYPVDKIVLYGWGHDLYIAVQVTDDILTDDLELFKINYQIIIRPINPRETRDQREVYIVQYVCPFCWKRLVSIFLLCKNHL